MMFISEKKKFSEKIAYLISLLTTPPLLSTLIISYLIIWYPELFYPISRRFALIISIIFLFVIPSFPILVKVYWGDFDFFISDRKKRSVYFRVTSVSYTSGAIISWAFESYILMIYHITFLILIFIISLLNYITKVSLHVSTAMCAITFVSSIIRGINPLLYLIVLLIIWARMRIKAHTFPQIIIGLIVGYFSPELSIHVLDFVEKLLLT